MNDFTLDPRLESDTFPLADLPLCRVLLMNDSRYPWAILVPRHDGISEVFELSDTDQATLWREATQLGNVMKTLFEGDKLNIATLGNVVSQLHVHVVVRHRTDATWPAPVWGNGSPEPYALEPLASLRDQLIAHIDRLNV
ncbi:diadenosine tetraphosphate (Ap4A) HIT family hydrolase [Vreelandella songnenensis]|uniref:Diadenosine tetraphosphate (Ap4A) HIT family hydrolase n=1 Tax=Vreelandella songnenensis TaxID=1176243 RepID=A0A2T0V9K8_9GAMM|nr:HIT domain-containing protein [Halomonas songnenensis]PRY66879.1 diadenosine tetraphosphate (Ap4A) HIT family hydrolase [Halomonas songnenensis]